MISGVSFQYFWFWTSLAGQTYRMQVRLDLRLSSIFIHSTVLRQNDSIFVIVSYFECWREYSTCFILVHYSLFGAILIHPLTNQQYLKKTAALFLYYEHKIFALWKYPYSMHIQVVDLNTGMLSLTRCVFQGNLPLLSECHSHYLKLTLSIHVIKFCFHTIL